MRGRRGRVQWAGWAGEGRAGTGTGVVGASAGALCNLPTSLSAFLCSYTHAGEGHAAAAQPCVQFRGGEGDRTTPGGGSGTRQRTLRRSPQVAEHRVSSPKNVLPQPCCPRCQADINAALRWSELELLAAVRDTMQRGAGQSAVRARTRAGCRARVCRMLRCCAAAAPAGLLRNVYVCVQRWAP